MTVQSIRAPMPVPTAAVDYACFHQYTNEDTTLFVSQDSENVLESELRLQKGDFADPRQRDLLFDQVYGLREYYKSIPQLKKIGPNGITPIYNSGVILTMDLLVGYFEQVQEEPNGEVKDVLHIILLWSDGDQDNEDPALREPPGWVMPGKRDQAYSENKPDISIREANLSLVEKEIGIDRSQVAHHAVLGYFDDRLRELRGKMSGFVSFVLLHRKPELVPGRMIGIPLNGLKLLAERRISLAQTPESGAVVKMGRNHDSLILAAFRTAKFYHTMEKVKLNQVRFKELLQSNPHAERPAFSPFDPALECPLCFDLFVDAYQICSQGHSICGICLKQIREANQHDACPNCRTPMNPAPNLALNHVVQHIAPEAYRKRYEELHKEPPHSWENDPAFCGHFVSYSL